MKFHEISGSEISVADFDTAITACWGLMMSHGEGFWFDSALAHLILPVGRPTYTSRSCTHAVQVDTPRLRLPVRISRLSIKADRAGCQADGMSRRRLSPQDSAAEGRVPHFPFPQPVDACEPKGQGEPRESHL